MIFVLEAHFSHNCSVLLNIIHWQVVLVVDCALWKSGIQFCIEDGLLSRGAKVRFCPARLLRCTNFHVIDWVSHNSLTVIETTLSSTKVISLFVLALFLSAHTIE